jgi:hypothetical protein
VVLEAVRAREHLRGGRVRAAPGAPLARVRVLAVIACVSRTNIHSEAIC